MLSVIIFAGYFSWRLVFLPLGILMLFMLCLGTSLWTSALMVRYRDIRFIVPFIVQFGLFISPVGYGSFIVPEQWRPLFYINPLAGLIDGFRWMFFGVGGSELWLSITISTVVNSLILILGFRFFRKMERQFADII